MILTGTYSEFSLDENTEAENILSRKVALKRREIQAMRLMTGLYLSLKWEILFCVYMLRGKSLNIQNKIGQLVESVSRKSERD